MVFTTRTGNLESGHSVDSPPFFQPLKRNLESILDLENILVHSEEDDTLTSIPYSAISPTHVQSDDQIANVEYRIKLDCQ